jgi:hypothetical protein
VCPGQFSEVFVPMTQTNLSGVWVERLYPTTWKSMNNSCLRFDGFPQLPIQLVFTKVSDLQDRAVVVVVVVRI